MRHFVILAVFYVLFAFQFAQSCCMSLNSKADTLADGSIVIYQVPPSHQGVPSPIWDAVDTLSPAKLLKEMLNVYHSSAYALIGEIKEVRTFRYPMNDTMDSEMDSVFFLIHSTLKGKVSNGFWSQDNYNHTGRIYRRGEDTASYARMMSINPGPYTDIKNRLALMLTSSLDSIRQTGLEPAGFCTFSHQGYYIGSDFSIEKHYSYSILDITIKVPMDDFLQAITAGVNSPVERAQSNFHVSTAREGQFLNISVPAPSGPVRIDITNGNGRIAGTLTTQSNGTARWELSGVSAGMYYIRAIGPNGTAFQKLRL